MKAPLIARILGLALLIAGLLGFAPFALTPAGGDATYIQLAAGYGFLGGLFPVNYVHDSLHVIFGAWGIIASFGFAASVRWCRWVGSIYLLLVIVGAIPITNTLFGVAPIYGHDVWLHFIIAIVAIYGGFGAGQIAPDEPEAGLMPPPM